VELASGTSANLAGRISDETGTGVLVFATSPSLVTPVLGTPASGTLTNCTFPTLNQSTTGSSASCTGLSATATALATGRTIGGVSFDGTANIAVTLSATATALATGRAIGGTTFDGTAAINIANIIVADTTDTTCSVALFESATGNTLAPKTDGGLTYNAGTGMLTATGFTGPLTGNASGSSGSTTGNAATVTTNADLTGDVTSSGNATTLATVTTAKGGSGLTSFTSGDILYYASGTTLTKLAKPGTPADEVLTFATGESAPSWVAAGGGAVTGSITIYAGLYTATISGYLHCNGDAVSRTTYADLFAVTSTQFGTGDGSSTFNVPDLRSRFPRGAPASTSCGATGGADTVALTTSELASHTHSNTITDPGHEHGLKGYGGSSAGNKKYNESAGTSPHLTTGGDAYGTTNVTAGVSITNVSAGSGSAHENKPSYLEILYIIKT